MKYGNSPRDAWGKNTEYQEVEQDDAHTTSFTAAGWGSAAMDSE